MERARKISFESKVQRVSLSRLAIIYTGFLSCFPSTNLVSCTLRVSSRRGKHDSRSRISQITRDPLRVSGWKLSEGNRSSTTKLSRYGSTPRIEENSAWCGDRSRSRINSQKQSSTEKRQRQSSTNPLATFTLSSAGTR